MSELQVMFKLRVKIGCDEFEAEGPPELVAQRFEEFRLLIRKPERGSGEAPRTGSDAEGAERREAVGPDIRKATDPPHDLASLLRCDLATGQVSLATLPEGKQKEADAVLLLLLGHKRFRGEDEVPVTLLNEGLRQSGCPVSRLDRVLMSYTKHHLVLKSGVGKGGRYRLTNQGLKKADALAHELSKRGAEV